MRVCICTWNAGQFFQSQESLDFSSWLDSDDDNLEKPKHDAPADIYAVGFQETVLLPHALIGLGATQLSQYQDSIRRDIEQHAALHRSSDKARRYRLVKKSIMGAIALLIYAEETIALQIEDISTAYVGCGPVNMSNKGAVGIRFVLRSTQTSWTFLSAHLAALDKLERRNEDWRNIVSQLVFESKGSQYQIYDTSYLFVMGDLNYRISTKIPRTLSVPEVQQRIDEDVLSLLAHDQLSQEKEAKRTMHALSEGKITFSPTYKFILGTDKYKSFSKRIPGWCDRILYAGHDEVTVVQYRSIMDVQLSDHKPVKALFDVPSSDSSTTSSSSNRLAARAPYPIDTNRASKQVLGFIADKTVGSIWSILLRLGGGNVWLGAALAIFLISIRLFKIDYISYIRTLWQ